MLFCLFFIAHRRLKKKTALVFERFIVNIVVPEKTFNMSVNGNDNSEDQQSEKYTIGKQLY